MTYLKIRQERLKRGKIWTQEYVGNHVGVTKVAIHDIETGKQKPSYDVLVKLENLFGRTHRYLLAQATDDQSECTNTNQAAQDSITKARAVDSATKGFRVDTDLILDIAADGRIDNPARRGEAQELHGALGRVLA